MGKIKKTTRKFEAKHLPKELEKRKATAKVKQKFQLREKKKKQREKDRAEKTNEAAEDGRNTTRTDSVGQELFKSMNVEEFFAGGFQVPNAPKPAKVGSKDAQKDKKVKSVETRKKRKRTESEEEAENRASEEDVGSESDEEKSRAEFSRHKVDIKELAEKDPEFYKFLQENDKELLEFDEDLPGIDELSSAEEETERPKKIQRTKKGPVDVEDDEEDRESGNVGAKAEEVSKADIALWAKALTDKKSLRTLRKVVLAFRAAAHINEGRPEGREFKYKITSPEIYHEILILGLEQIPKVLNYHLPVKESSNGKIRISTDTKKFRNLTPLLKLHGSSLLTLLPHLTDPGTVKLHLNSTLELLPYLLPFRKFLKLFLKSVVDIWTSSSCDEATRITAFLVIRKAAIIGDEGMKENCLKALYAGLVKASRNTNVHTIKGINLMKNSAAEVFGLVGMDRVGYVVGFGYIRQLAIHLRNSITNNSKDSYKTIYNWQYVHSLDFWSRVLSTYCSILFPPINPKNHGPKHPLYPLIYPLVQVTLGAARLIPTATYFPLRFNLIRSLLRLSMHTSTYIPLAPLIFEPLSSTEMKKKPKSDTLKSLDMSVTLRAPKSYLKTKSYQDTIVSELVELFSEFYILYAKHVAFPELAIPTIVLLKRYMKKNETKNAKLNNQFHALVQKLELNAKFVEERRRNIDFAPDRIEAVEGFLKEIDWERTPLGAYVVGLRKMSEERRKLLDESHKERREHDEDDDEDEMMVIDSDDVEEDGEGVIVGGSEDEEDEDEDEEIEE